MFGSCWWVWLVDYSLVGAGLLLELVVDELFDGMVGWIGGRLEDLLIGCVVG